MKTPLKNVFLILIIIAFVSACAGDPGGGAPGDMPVGESLQDDQVAEEEVGKMLEGAYGFVMSAEVDGLVADMAYDQLKSDWWGDFSVDAEGLITGDGLVSYDALMFAVNEELCGFAWTELGDVEFEISGKVLKKGGEYYYPVKLFLRDPQVHSISDAEPTCEDPQSYLSQIPPQYLEIHRDALLSIVLTHLHQNIGNQLQLEETFTGQSSTVDYTILISLDPVDLD